MLVIRYAISPTLHEDKRDVNKLGLYNLKNPGSRDYKILRNSSSRNLETNSIDGKIRKFSFK